MLDLVHKDVHGLIFRLLDDSSLGCLARCCCSLSQLTFHELDLRMKRRVSGVYELLPERGRSLRFREDVGDWFRRVEFDVSALSAKLVVFYDGSCGRGGKDEEVVWHGVIGPRIVREPGALVIQVVLDGVEVQEHYESGFEQKKIDLSDNRAFITIRVLRSEIQLSDGMSAHLNIGYELCDEGLVLQRVPQLS